MIALGQGGFHVELVAEGAHDLLHRGERRVPCWGEGFVQAVAGDARLLRERLRSSKNIILFLSSSTTASHAPTEEIEYGIGNQELPAIVVHPDFDPIDWSGRISDRAKSLWNSLPAFKRLMGQVPTLHAPMKKEALANALTDPDFMVSTKTTSGCYRL